MRMVSAIVAGVVGGFLAGVLISQVGAIAGLLLLGQPVGIKFLPIGTAVVGAIIVPVLAARRQGRVR
jgi:uncharacterized membrane protein YeaQ/YmgE (transglycosylase-associated protein family)